MKNILSLILLLLAQPLTGVGGVAVPSGEEARPSAVTLLGDEDGSSAVTLLNGVAWMDTDGEVVQAHGGNIVETRDSLGRRLFYMVGEDRGAEPRSRGFIGGSWNPDVNLYSSPDLRTWTFEGKIIRNGVTTPELGTSRMIERPKLLHCPLTGRWVIWCHYEASDYSASEVGVFSAPDVHGPWQLEWAGRPLGIKSRDCNVFVDEPHVSVEADACSSNKTDGGEAALPTAYFISTIEENQHLGLFRLSPDYLRAEEVTVLMEG